MKIKLYVMAFLCSLLWGCSKPVEKAQVPGTYVLKVGNEFDVLEFESSGTYSHRYKAADGRAVIDTGSWEFGTVEDAPTLTLRNFKSNLSELKAMGGGFFLLRVTSSGKGLRLWVDEEKGICYQQEK